VVDTSGIGNSSETNLPLTGLRVDLRGPSGSAVGSGYVDANGDFSVQGSALVGSSSGSLVVTAQSIGSVVRAISAGQAARLHAGDERLVRGRLRDRTTVINESADPGGVLRAPLNIARAIQSVRDFAGARTSDPISQLEVLYDTNSTAPTSYQKAGAAPASMRVSGAASNPDAWDSHVTARRTRGTCWAPSPPSDDGRRLRVRQGDRRPERLRRGFGYYLNAAVSLDSSFYDGQSAVPRRSSTSRPLVR